MYNDDKYVRMIGAANAMMEAWCSFDKKTFFANVGLDLRMSIPVFGLDVIGAANIWDTRTQLTTDALDPHTLDSHVVVDNITLTCILRMISPETGEEERISKVTLTFEASSYKVTKYYQDIIFSV